MSGITSSVGLFSGIDTGALIEQLLAIDARPRQLAQQQVAILQARQTAMIAINSSMLGFNSAISSFTTSNVFESSSATSSDTDVLTATAQNRAAAGSYKFIVDRLVSTQQSLSKGFADRDSSSFGATSFTFEGIQGAVSNSTRLTELNGGNGVARGKFDITDRAGNTATIDASKALTLDDVVNAINAQQDILITATVEDGGIKITDNSGGGGNLVIQDQFGRTTAADLGIAGSFASNTVAKADLLTLNDGTALSALRDGLGIMIRDGEGKTDLEITTRDGTKHLINLGLIQQNFVTEDYTSAGVSYSKDDVYTGPPDPEPDGFEPPPIESRITQTRAATVGDLITAIESQTGGDVEVSINAATGTLTFDDLTGETISDFKIEAPSAIDTTANDLLAVASVAGTSITTGQLLAGTNSVLTSSLNGGAGLTQTAITFDDRSGAGSVNLTLSAADISGSLSDLVEKLNTDLAAAGQGVTISVNESGRGLIATDTTGGSGALVITGALAAELGLDTGAGGVTQNTVEGTSLQKAYVGLQTRVSDFNNGQGVGLGTFRITDASGGVEEIEINSSHENLADIINLINSRPNIDVTAAINDNGDGIVITDTSGATGSNKQLLIEDVSGTVASNLRIAGTHTESAGSIKVNGSLETTVTFDADDTLDEAVQKINDSGAGISATVINDGSPGTPYRINFTSRNSGESGRVLIDTGGFDLQLRTLSEGQDAVTFFGADDPADAILITSSSNTLDDVISGVTIDLKQTSTAPVTLTVGTDTASIESAVSRFVDTFNTVLSTIDQYDFFDEESEDKGILFGDYTTQSIKRQLYSTVQSPGVLLDGQFQFLFQAGVKIGEDARLEFDSQQFRETLEQDFDAIEALFSERQLLPNEPIEVIPGTGITTPDTQDDFGRLGVPARLSLLIESFTDSISGSLTGRRNTIDTQIQDQNDRIARLDLQLENKRQRYQAQFIAMERAIGELQNQAGALNSLGQAG